MFAQFSFSVVLKVKIKFKVTLRLSKSKSHCDWGPVNQAWCRAPIWGSWPDIFTVWHLRSCFCGAPSLTRGPVSFYICCWPLPAQSFSGPSPLEMETIFYCLRLETSLFVASYDSQGHGGGIRPRLHTGVKLLVKVKVTLRLTASQSVSLGVEPPSGAHDQAVLCPFIIARHGPHGKHVSCVVKNMCLLVS
jgi:hypothetical protein